MNFSDVNADDLLSFMMENLDTSINLVKEDHKELVFNIPNDL